jgi:hypothetical protein
MTWQQSLVLGLLAALVALLIQGKLRPALPSRAPCSSPT